MKAMRNSVVVLVCLLTMSPVIAQDKKGRTFVDSLEQPVVSQHLAVLRNQNIVAAEKEGTSVRYTLRDPLVGELLDVARRIFNNHLVSASGLLRELQRETRRG